MIIQNSICSLVETFNNRTMRNLEKINSLTKQEIEKLNRLILSVAEGEETPKETYRALFKTVDALKQIKELTSKRWTT